VIDIFVSRPTWVADEFKEGLNGFLSFLDSHDIKPRTLGSTDYPTDSPLDEVINIMDECKGVIILGYPQIYLASGKIKGRENIDILLPTEWNHIEATLAYVKKKPLLIIHHKGITRGIFEHGAISKFIYEKDLSKQNWFLSENIKGALKKWKASIMKIEMGKSSASTPTSSPSSFEIKSNVTQSPKPYKYDKRRLSQARKWLDEFIERGEELSQKMQSRSFNWAQLELWVHRWVHGIQREIYDKIPEYSEYLVAQQGGLSEEERILYNGWNIKQATLRVTVDRYLVKLRTVQSKL
jgi:hypothetical protein